MNEIVIYVSGGIVQEVWAKEPASVKVIDADNLRGEGKSWDEIKQLSEAESRDKKSIY